MPRAMPLIHPSMATSQDARFPERVTIQQGTESRDSFRAIVQTWNPAPGIPTDLHAAIEPGAGSERRTMEQTYEVAFYTIAISGYYPAIDEKMRAVDSQGTVYDIDAVDIDQLHTVTQLTGRVVT